MSANSYGYIYFKIKIKKPNKNNFNRTAMLASSEAGRDNCLTDTTLPYESGG